MKLDYYITNFQSTLAESLRDNHTSLALTALVVRSFTQSIKHRSDNLL